MAVLTVPMEQMSATVRIEKLSPTTPKRFSVDSMSLFVMVAGASTRPENVMVTATVLTERMSTTARTEKFQALTTLTACSVPLSNLFAISGDVLTSR